MMPQIQPSNWSCLATSFAIVLDIPVSEVFEYVGHDGSEYVPQFLHLPEPYNRRGHHIQEMIKLASLMMYSVTPFEAGPNSVSRNSERFVIPGDWPQLVWEQIQSSEGVVVGRTLSGADHAIAVSHGIVVNPSGKPIDLKTGFYIDTYWRLIKSNSDSF